MPALLRNLNTSRRATLPGAAPGARNTGIIFVNQHDSATDFLTAAGYILQRHQTRSNLILPYAVSGQMAEGNGDRIPTASESRRWLAERIDRMAEESNGELREDSTNHGPIHREAYYMTVWTINGGDISLDFAISCFGPKPLFIFSPKQKSDFTQEYLQPRMNVLASRMLQFIPSKRVFSIFGPTRPVRYLASEWSHISGHSVYTTKTSRGVEMEPFYHASYTFCTAQTFCGQRDLPPNHRVRLADMGHLSAVAPLIENFANDSVFFPTTTEGAVQETAELIKKKQLFVYEVADPRTRSIDVVSLVAVTRESSDIAAISKVYTSPEWRGRGFAQNIVAAVTSEVLGRKPKCVLFVAHDNPAAAKVYGRVGFIGVGENRPHPEVEDWIELGFNNTIRGYW